MYHIYHQTREDGEKAIFTKRILTITCIAAAGVLLSIGVYGGVVVATAFMAADSQRIAIIGGADGPTASYLLSQILFRSPLFLVGLASLIVFLTSLAALILWRFRNK